MTDLGDFSLSNFYSTCVVADLPVSPFWFAIATVFMQSRVLYVKLAKQKIALQKKAIQLKQS